MRKIILLILTILLIPNMVYAQNKYEMSKIELIGINGTDEEKEKATFEDGKLNINVGLANPGDYVKYEIQIKHRELIIYMI